MAIFPKLVFEPILQVDDKSRLDATTSFVSTDDTGITSITIDPEVGVTTPIDVTSNKYLEWAYSSNGTKTVQVSVTGSTGTDTRDYTIEVMTAEEDCLFSNDQMLVTHEGEILKYVKKGRTSFIDKHREAQRAIIEYLDEAKIWKNNTGSDSDQYVDDVPQPYTKADICALQGDDFEQFERWSTFMVLENIFRDLSKQVDDIFDRKSNQYRLKKNKSKDRGVLRLDKEGNGEIGPTDFVSLDTCSFEKL